MIMVFINFQGYYCTTINKILRRGGGYNGFIQLRKKNIYIFHKIIIMSISVFT